MKAPTTRKLRRRPNDPIHSSSTGGPSDKRRKLAPAQLAYLLEDNEINEDAELDRVPVTALVIAAMGQLPIASRTTIILQLGIQTNLLQGSFYKK